MCFVDLKKKKTYPIVIAESLGVTNAPDNLNLNLSPKHSLWPRNAWDYVGFEVLKVTNNAVCINCSG